MTTTTLLFELGTEELPAGELQGMALALRDNIAHGCQERDLHFGDIQWFATPRRLAVLVTALSTQAPDQEQQVLGPPVSAAKDGNGDWTPAALGFARKQSIEVSELQELPSDKGTRLGVIRTLPGARVKQCAGDIISTAVATIPMSKKMRWGRSRHEFLRPVQWLVALLDGEVLDLSLFDCTADRYTRGHRFHHQEPIVLNKAADYEQALMDGFVIADFHVRRQRIEQQVIDIATSEGFKAEIDRELLDEVCGLVEWPQAIKGCFDADFLEVPSEALISSMREHQKYFHLVDLEGKLQPLFITIANIVSSDPSVVAKGNEKVIRPRLADAAFFFNNDKKSALEARSDRLNGVVFQQKLGTLADKQRRIIELSQYLARAMGADAELTARAALLAKCDLVSEMVLEFPELQGIAGAYYAEHDGEPQVVSEAVEQHYWPRFAGDRLPTTLVATAVALADRLDTLVGIFGIGQTPTGSKDPFALRRASLAIIRMLIANDMALDLDELISHSVNQYPERVLEHDPKTSVKDYILERLKAWYDDQGIGVDVLRAVLATGIANAAEIDRRVSSVHEFAQTDAAASLAAANKRVANILAKATEQAQANVDIALFETPEEHQLFKALSESEDSLTPLLAARDYRAALAGLATLQTPVDAFFEGVMVNAEEPSIRQNRYNLLYMLRQQFIRIADIALLASTGS